jgi:AcrR family transcriptional regulator
MLTTWSLSEAVASVPLDVYTVNMPYSRERALRCACDMFIAEGIEGFSLRKLARSMDVSAPALYRHFTGKEGVLRAVITEAFKVFSSYLYASLEAATPQERLARAGERYVAFALEHPRYYEVIHIPPATLGFTTLPGEAQSQAQATRQFLVDRVKECMSAGVISEDDPDLVAAAIWGFSHGLVSLYLGGQLAVDRDHFHQYFRVVTSRLLIGIGGKALVLPPDITQTPNEWSAEGSAASLRTSA